jgi:hypothetical protein
MTQDELLNQVVVRELSPQDLSFIQGNSFKNRNAMVAIPTRGMIHYRAIMSWKTLMYPVNSKSVQVFVPGMEVGEARNRSVEHFLSDSSLKYLVFIDDDLILPEDGLLKLYRGMEEHGYDIIGSVYRTKETGNETVAYKFKEGMMGSIPNEELLNNEYLDVDVVGMGFTIIKREVFYKLSQPWYKTVQEKFTYGTRCYTEDVFFCKKAKEEGFKIGLATDVICPHMNYCLTEI